MIANRLSDAEKEYGAEIVIAAFKKASDKGIRGVSILAYCQSIFEQYKDYGIPNVHSRQYGQPKKDAMETSDKKVEGVIIEE